MDRAKLMKELKNDEGRSTSIYYDHLSIPTFGVGHMVLKTDPEYGKPIGTKVTMERIDEVFEKDLDSVEADCKRLYPDFDDLPEQGQRVIANMMFNLGLPRLRKFVNMKKRIDERDWVGAALEGQDSRWFKQVPARAGRLMRRLKALG